MTLFEELTSGGENASKRLQWLPELGIGWYPVDIERAPYDGAYWERYRAMDQTDMACELTRQRIDLVVKHLPRIGDREVPPFDRPLCVDVGIGGGRFMMQAPGDWHGFDVNPFAVDWIKQRRAWYDPWLGEVDVATFWDSLEHIHDPRPLLRNVRRWCFVSLPIFENAEHVLASRHFRRDEHCWYFTNHGFIGLMNLLGFECRERNRMEVDAGREDIGTYAFERVREVAQ